MVTSFGGSMCPVDWAPARVGAACRPVSLCNITPFGSGEEAKQKCKVFPSDCRTLERGHHLTLHGLWSCDVKPACCTCHLLSNSSRTNGFVKMLEPCCLRQLHISDDRSSCTAYVSFLQHWQRFFGPAHRACDGYCKTNIVTPAAESTGKKIKGKYVD